MEIYILHLEKLYAYGEDIQISIHLESTTEKDNKIHLLFSVDELVLQVLLWSQLAQSDPAYVNIHIWPQLDLQQSTFTESAYKESPYYLIYRMVTKYKYA